MKDIIEGIYGLLIIIFLIILYFLPALIAYGKQKESFAKIFVFNLFLGWTFIFWIIALIWAV